MQYNRFIKFFLKPKRTEHLNSKCNTQKNVTCLVGTVSSVDRITDYNGFYLSHRATPLPSSVDAC